MGLNLGQSCFQISRIWGQVAPSWSQVGPKLGRSWSQWVEVGPKLGRCWPKLTPSRANVAAMSDRNGASGQCWADLQNVQITSPAHFLAPGEHGPPQLKPYQTVRAAHLSHSLLHYASAPSVRADFETSVKMYNVKLRFVHVQGIAFIALLCWQGKAEVDGFTNKDARDHFSKTFGPLYFQGCTGCT